MWGPTGRKEDLDNVTKRGERVRQAEKGTTNLYAPNQDIRLLYGHFMSVPNVYWLALLLLWFWKLTYVSICLLIYELQCIVSLIQMQWIDIDGRIIVYKQILP